MDADMGDTDAGKDDMDAHMEVMDADMGAAQQGRLQMLMMISLLCGSTEG